jgi:hypothetical protein
LGGMRVNDLILRHFVTYAIVSFVNLDRHLQKSAPTYRFGLRTAICGACSGLVLFIGLV